MCRNKVLRGKTCHSVAILAMPLDSYYGQTRAGSHLRLQSKLFNPHCILGLLANCKHFQLFEINNVGKNS